MSAGLSIPGYSLTIEEDGSYLFVEQRANGNKFRIVPEEDDTSDDILAAAREYAETMALDGTSLPQLAKRVKNLEAEVRDLKRKTGSGGSL